MFGFDIIPKHLQVTSPAQFVLKNIIPFTQVTLCNLPNKGRSPGSAVYHPLHPVKPLTLGTRSPEPRVPPSHFDVLA